ncbi:hypothetical protein [Actinomadura formosensis]|uniref:hypothetical protein n=1 Tax=Actinomadura formosensis TaxID=60706 RepID=UPI003D905F5E
MDSQEYQRGLAALIASAIDYADAPDAATRPQPDVAARIDALMPPPTIQRTYSLGDPPTLDGVQALLGEFARDAALAHRAEMYAAVSAACNVGMRLLTEVAALTGETRAQVLARVALDGSPAHGRAS